MSNISSQEFNALAQRIGAQAAMSEIIRRGVTTINGQPIYNGPNARQANELPPLDPSQPTVGGALPQAVEAPQPPAGALPQITLPTPSPTANVGALTNGSIAISPFDDVTDDLRQKRQAAMNPMQQVQDYFTAALQPQLAQYDAYRDRMFPTDKTSQAYKDMERSKWFGIAAQFLKPTASSSFGESLGNVAGYMSEREEAQRQALAAMEAKRQELIQAYDLAGLKAGSEAYQEALKERNRPDVSYQLDDKGNVREVPKQVATPQTDQEYAALPIGTWYRVPSGANAGAIIQKLHP